MNKEEKKVAATPPALLYGTVSGSERGAAMGPGRAVATAIGAAIMKPSSNSKNRTVQQRFTSKPIDFDEYNDPHYPHLHNNQNPSSENHRASRGMLKAILDRSVAQRFTSKPIDLMEDKKSVLQSFPSLTAGEREYLEQLLETDDPDSIYQASLTLSDPILFPPEPERNGQQGEDASDESSFPTKRDSKVQQQLFRIHEFSQKSFLQRQQEKQALLKPKLDKRKNSILESTHSIVPSKEKSKKMYEDQRKNSILESTLSILSLEDDDESSSSFFNSSEFKNHQTTKNNNQHRNDGTSIEEDHFLLEDITNNDKDDDGYNSSTTDKRTDCIGPRDVMPWLLEGYREGIEIEEGVDGRPPHVVGCSSIEEGEECFRTAFQVLGTTADDISCHPHVLSPPLMESLLEFFIPESLSVDHNFWIKYSLVRDGPSVWTLFRHIRASTRTILAIETTDGHVFGSFTSSSWRLSSSSSAPLFDAAAGVAAGKNTNANANANTNAMNDTSVKGEDAGGPDYYGTKDSFLWKMRQSRFDSQNATTVEQAVMLESAMDVFPYTGKNPCVQYCGGQKDISIGLGEHCNALRIDANLRYGATGCSETFGNPSLMAGGCSRDHDTASSSLLLSNKYHSFEIANLEVWTLTPHDNVKEAERAELSSLFLEEEKGLFKVTTVRRSIRNKKLNFLGILVGNTM